MQIRARSVSWPTRSAGAFAALRADMIRIVLALFLVTTVVHRSHYQLPTGHRAH